MQSFCIGCEKRIHCSGGHFRMLTIMDRIKKIILIISTWMKFIEISIQMRQDLQEEDYTGFCFLSHEAESVHLPRCE